MSISKTIYRHGLHHDQSNNMMKSSVFLAFFWISGFSFLFFLSLLIQMRMNGVLPFEQSQLLLMISSSLPILAYVAHKRIGYFRETLKEDVSDHIKLKRQFNLVMASSVVFFVASLVLAMILFGVLPLS